MLRVSTRGLEPRSNALPARPRERRLRSALGGCALAVIVMATGPAQAQTAGDLEQQIDALRQMMETNQAAYESQIERLEQRIRELEAQPLPARQTDPAVAAPAPAPASRYEGLISQGASTGAASAARGGGISAGIGLNIDVAAGSSTAPDRLVKSGEAGLQGGAHDPNTNGFTLQAAELSANAAVDPYFDGFANILFLIDKEGETVVELEEAWAQTTALPWGLQLRAGQYYTDFGRANKRHVHQQDFVDQPVVIGRMFGGDGQRGVGARLGWLTPLPWFSEVILGAQNCLGETMPSFCGEDEGIGEFENVTGDPQDFSDRVVLSARWLNGFDLADSLSANIGASFVAGPNRTGPGNDTWIAGGDLYVKWQPARTVRGFPFVSWESEFLYREFEAGDNSAGVEVSTLKDWGLYSQALYGFTPGWVTGLRFEYADGTGDSAEGGNETDFNRAQRYRASANLTWYPTEFSKIRLQYNHDWAENLPGAGVLDDASGVGAFAQHSADSVWVQVGVSLGAHGAHTF